MLTNPEIAHTQKRLWVSPALFHLICILLEHTKGPVLQTQSGRIFTTQGNSRLTKRSSSESPASTAYQKLETLNQTNDSALNTESKDTWTKVFTA